MALFIEMECPGYRAVVRWEGTFGARPKCLRCGYRATDPEVLGDSTEVESFREFLARRKAWKAAGSKPDGRDREYMLGK